MFKPVRCGNLSPTPYLKKHFSKLSIPKEGLILDLGCGNLRNTNYIKSLGYHNVIPFDRAGDFGLQINLGSERLPVLDKSVSAVLCNYLMCFFSDEERRHLSREISNKAETGGILVFEMYRAKTGVSYDMDTIRSMFPSWETIHSVKDRFILRKK